MIYKKILILIFTLSICAIKSSETSSTLKTISNLTTGSSATAFCDNKTVPYGATNVDITISGRGNFGGIGDKQDQCVIQIEYYHPGMDPCIQRRVGYFTSSGSITALRTCTIPGPLYYNQSLVVTATATSYRGAYSSDTASCKITVGQKPPGPNPNPNTDSTNWGLILGISIPGGIVLIVVCCCCKKKKKQQKLLRGPMRIA